MALRPSDWLRVRVKGRGMLRVTVRITVRVTARADEDARTAQWLGYV